jgi:hypothetical protein
MMRQLDSMFLLWDRQWSMADGYCELIRIPTPSLDDLAGRRDVKLFHLMVVALLERGGPMSIDELADRLDDAGVLVPTDDLRMSLSKAWHGLKPIYRAPDGRFALELEDFELGHIVRALGLDARDRNGARASTPLPPPMTNEDEPLSRAEVEAALRDPSRVNIGIARQIAAVLDAFGAPMALKEIDAVLADITQSRISVAKVQPATLNARLLEQLGDRRLQISQRGVAELHATRRFVRTLGRVEDARRAQTARFEADLARRREEANRREAEAERAAEKHRRCVLRAVVDTKHPIAAALLDIQARTIRTFVGEKALSELANVLPEYDLVIGLDVRDVLHGLGLDSERWRIIDLRAAPKTRRLNKSGRTLKITPDLLMRGTIGVSRPLGDPKTLKRYLADGEETKIVRRLESDAKSLFAYYNYGRLHRTVRLRWGFIDETCSVGWALDGEPSVYSLLDHARETDTPVDIVVGRSAPGWADPWSRAKRVYVVAIDAWRVTVRTDDGRELALQRDEIQTVRPA